MTTINNGGPAFPTTPSNYENMEPFGEGMTLRQYAAIKLRVPDSGDEWLDEMIRKSLRDYFAAKAMQGMVTAEYERRSSPDDWARHAYRVADAMLKAREVQQ